MRAVGVASGLANRWPWVVPLASFASGWLGYALIQRGESMAQLIAILALTSWPWLLVAESLRNGRLGRWTGGRVPEVAVTFVTQMLQQEILFFSLAFLVAATRLDPGQVLFTGLVVAAALLSTLDRIYCRYVAAHPIISLAFHAYCSFLAALVVLPIAASVSLERALPVALVITGAAVVVNLRRVFREVPGTRGRIGLVMAVLLAPALAWQTRAWIPAAGLVVSEALISDRIENLVPGPDIRDWTAQDLFDRGVVAFVAIRAPMGLHQEVVFVWRHESEVLDQVNTAIEGGSQDGWRTYSRKRNVPEDPRGRWSVEVRTPQGQLVQRLRFVVT